MKKTETYMRAVRHGIGILRECPRCLFTEDIAKIPSDGGQCNYCDLQDALKLKANPADWDDIVAKIKAKGRGKQYDCLIGISGGEDSSILLWMAVNAWNLRPLVIHFNNRANRPEADNNIRVITKAMNVNFIEYFVDQREYDRLTDAFLKAGVQDADIPNDIAMAKLMYSAARQYGIKYILNGHNYAREGSSPAAWSYMDAKYVQSVYKRWTGTSLKNYPLYTFWDQIMQGILGIKQVRPYHYHPELERAPILDALKAVGWQYYGEKHNENIYTAFVGSFLLPKKFKIDKRITYLSAQIREGFITKEFANEALQKEPEFDISELPRAAEVLNLVDMSRIGKRSDYARYNFKRWKPVIWLLSKMNIVPHTMFVKYCR